MSAVPITQAPLSRKSQLAEILGQSLGQGLGSLTNSYYANKAIEGVMNDPELQAGDSSKRMGALQQALMPFGQYGSNLLKERMSIENQRINEEKAKSAKKTSEYTIGREDRLMQNQAISQVNKNYNEILKYLDTAPIKDTNGWKKRLLQEKYQVEKSIKNNQQPSMPVFEELLGIKPGKTKFNKSNPDHVRQVREIEAQYPGNKDQANAALADIFEP